MEVQNHSKTREANSSRLSSLENCSIGTDLIDPSDKVSLMKPANDTCNKFLSFNELENIESNIHFSSDISAAECSLSTNDNIQLNECSSEKMVRNLYYGKKF